MRYTPDQPIVAFLCNYEHNPAMSPHVAKYMKEGDYLLCTKNNMAITEVPGKLRLWLQGRFNIPSTRTIVKFKKKDKKEKSLETYF